MADCAAPPALSAEAGKDKSVQQCRGPLGERLKRERVSAPVQGDLAIGNAKHSFVATLERPDLDRRHQVLYPLFDVRVQTLEDGLLVIGFRINADAPTRRARMPASLVLRARHRASTPVQQQLRLRESLSQPEKHQLGLPTKNDVAGLATVAT